MENNKELIDVLKNINENLNTIKEVIIENSNDRYHFYRDIVDAIRSLRQ